MTSYTKDSAIEDQRGEVTFQGQELGKKPGVPVSRPQIFQLSCLSQECSHLAPGSAGCSEGLANLFRQELSH